MDGNPKITDLVSDMPNMTAQIEEKPAEHKKRKH
jgi:hypothetical protein